MGKGAARRDPDGSLHQVFHHETSLYGRGEGPRIELEFAEVDGRAVCARVVLGVDFRNVEESEPTELTTAIWRSVKLATVIEEAVKSMHKLTVSAEKQAWRTAPRAREVRSTLEARQEERRRRPGRPPLARERYEEAAAIYEEARRHGSRAPTQTVADRLYISKWTAAKRVAKARQLGLIPPVAR